MAFKDCFAMLCQGWISHLCFAMCRIKKLLQRSLRESPRYTRQVVEPVMLYWEIGDDAAIQREANG